VAEQTLFTGELVVMRRFLNLQLGEQQPWQELLPDHQQVRARAVYFLLHRDHEIDVDSFLTHHLARLLQQIACHTERRSIREQGRVRGRIDWPATVKSRLGGEHAPTRYICRQVHRHFDTPENQVVRALVEAIAACLELVPPIARSGACYYPYGSHQTVPTAALLTRLEVACRSLRNHARLREISLLAEISEDHLRRAQSTTQEEYRLAARLWQCFQRTVRSRSWAEMIRLAHRVLPLPGDLDHDGELWLRLAAGLSRATS
jgi:hypothetical protein